MNKTRKNTKKCATSPYTKKHFQSGDGMLTYVWGPPMWHFLHTMSFNYPVSPTQEQKIHYRDFILSLKNVLPCGKCRANLSKNLKKLPLKMDILESRDSFSLYIYHLHEVVNKMLKKNSGLTYDAVRDRYEHFRARCLIGDTSSKDEKGCIEPLYGEKAKCLLKIVPLEMKCDTLQIDDKCIKRML
jgi:hypothetical protein